MTRLPSRLPSLDVLRFVAAVAVMLYHFTYVTDDVLTRIETVTRHGYLGVDLFFIISGFVVLWSARGRTPYTFTRARILRLYPEFWLAVLVSVVVFSATGRTFTGSEIARNLTMVPQYLGAPYVDGVYWTLGVEIKFYALLFGLLLLRQMPHVERWLYAWLLVLTAAVFVNVGSVLRSLALYPYGSLFAAGGLFFLVFDSGWTWPRRLGLLVALALSVAFGVERIGGFVQASDVTLAARIATAGVTASLFALFAWIAHPGGPRASFGSWAVTAGALTYPLYLLHNTGKALFLGHGWPAWLSLPLAVLFALAISYVVMLAGTRIVQPRLRRLFAAFDRPAAVPQGESASGD